MNLQGVLPHWRSREQTGRGGRRGEGSEDIAGGYPGHRFGSICAAIYLEWDVENGMLVGVAQLQLNYGTTIVTIAVSTALLVYQRNERGFVDAIHG